MPVAAAWRRSTSWSTRAAACRRGVRWRADAGELVAAADDGALVCTPVTPRVPGRRGGAVFVLRLGACSCFMHVPRAAVGPAAPCTPAGPARPAPSRPAACAREGGAEGARGGAVAVDSALRQPGLSTSPLPRGAGRGHGGAGEGRGCVHFAGGGSRCARRMSRRVRARSTVFLWATRERLYTVTPEDMDAVGAIHGRCRPRPRRSRRRCRRVALRACCVRRTCTLVVGGLDGFVTVLRAGEQGARARQGARGGLHARRIRAASRAEHECARAQQVSSRGSSSLLLGTRRGAGAAGAKRAARCRVEGRAQGGLSRAQRRGRC